MQGLKGGQRLQVSSIEALLADILTMQTQLCARLAINVPQSPYLLSIILVLAAFSTLVSLCAYSGQVPHSASTVNKIVQSQ